MTKLQQKNIAHKAMRFAERKHFKQVDDEGKDFFTAHPYIVGKLLLLVAPDDQNLIAAGFLHDVLEDTATTYNELKEEFGQDVADLVNEVTDTTDADGTKCFPRLHSQRGIMLKFADRLSNLSRMNSWNEKRKQQYLKKSRFWKSEVTK